MEMPNGNERRRAVVFAKRLLMNLGVMGWMVELGLAQTADSSALLRLLLLHLSLCQKAEFMTNL